MHALYAHVTSRRPFPPQLRSHDAGVATDPRELVRQTVAGVAFQFAAGEFFQNNLLVLPQLVALVLDHAAEGGCEHLIDAYCGSGLFALCGAARFKHVWGVEISKKGALPSGYCIISSHSPSRFAAVDYARASAAANGIQNAEFLRGAAEDIFSPVAQRLPPAAAPDATGCLRPSACVIVDPPRAGCDEAFIKQLALFSPRKVVYVSCDPVSGRPGDDLTTT